ncbi:hypothetical protein QTP88_002717 [Uroleucon formosanum]
MKENIINNFDIPSKVYAKEVNKLTNVAGCLMPNENNVKINLRRIPNNSYPTISSKEFVLEKLLIALKDTCSSVKSFFIDFEHAMIKAIEEVFEDSVSIHLCYYHLSQSVWRKVQNLGLATKYTKDKEFRYSVRMINALAFLPLNVI